MLSGCGAAEVREGLARDGAGWRWALPPPDPLLLVLLWGKREDRGFVQQAAEGEERKETRGLRGSGGCFLTWPRGTSEVPSPASSSGHFL